LIYINKTGQNKFSFFSYDDHYQIAGSLLKGCQQHWKESITRIAKNSTVVPPNRQTYFRHLISLLSRVNKIDFNSAIHTIVTEFPVTTLINKNNNKSTIYCNKVIKLLCYYKQLDTLFSIQERPPLAGLSRNL